MAHDLNYICETMGNLSGIPVRLYDRNEEILFYSMVTLPTDPMIIYKEEILAIDSYVSYFVTKHLNYYRIFNIENKKIIIGPTRFVPNTQQELRDIAFLANVSPENMPAFLSGMKAIIGLPLERLMQMLCLLHYLITGEKIEEAKKLLTYTDKSLLSISIYLSFSSQSHFTNIFKKMTGQLPKTYREQFSISGHDK